MEPAWPDTPEFETESDQEPSPVKMCPISKPSPTEEKEVVKRPVLEDKISPNSSGFFSVVTQQEEVKLMGFTSLRLGGSPAQPQNSSPSVSRNNDITNKRKIYLKEVFNEESETKKKRKLIPLDDNQEEGPKSPNAVSEITVEEKRKHNLDGSVVDKVMNKSSATEIHLSVPETAELNTVTGFETFKQSTENWSRQNQEQNLSVENSIEEYIHFINNQRKQLQEKEEFLSEAIKELEKYEKENYDASDAVKKVLTDKIKKYEAFIGVIRRMLYNPRARIMELQPAASRESFSQNYSEASSDGMKNNQIKIERGTVTPQIVIDTEVMDEKLAKRRLDELLLIRRIINSENKLNVPMKNSQS